MTIQTINTGSSANSGDGDSLRTAFAKVNSNFSYLESISVTTSTGFQNLIPSSDNIFNLGATTASWANLYLGNTVISVDSSSNLTVNGEILSNTKIGVSPPLEQTTGTFWYDTESGSLFIYYDDSWVQVFTGAGGGDDIDFLSVPSNIVPRSTALYDIGSQSKIWNTIYANTVSIGTSTLTVNAFNTLTFNGSPILGPSGPLGPQGPQGPQGPGADQPLDTTSSVSFQDLLVANSSTFEGPVFFTDNLVDLHSPPSSVGPVWLSDDGYDIGVRFRYFDSVDNNAGLIFKNQSKTLAFYQDSLSEITTGTYTGTWGTLELGGLILKTGDLRFADDSVQASAFVGIANTSTLSLFANTATFSLFATTATDVDGGSVRGSVVNGTTSTTQVGYLVVPQIRIDNTSTYTLTLDDQGKHVYCVTSSSQTIIIPPYASVNFPIGTAVTILQRGTGTVSINTGTGVVLVFAGTEEEGNRTLLNSGMTTLINVENDVWFISGTGII